MVDTVAGHAGEIVEGAVEAALESVEGAVVAAEARAEAAEDALEAITDSARRDILHDDIDELRTECETWQEAQDARARALETLVTTLQAELSTMREQMVELANRSTVTTVSTLPASQEPLAPAADQVVTVTTVEPTSAAPGATVAAPEVPASQRRWI